MTPKEIKEIETKDMARPIRVFTASKPSEHCGTFCLACMHEDLSVDLSVLCEQMSGKKCISICCRPITEGNYCVKHSIPLVKRVQEYIAVKAEEVLKLAVEG